MKRMFVAVFGAVALAALAMPLYAANGRGMAKLSVNGKDISIDYGKPSLKGRKVEDLLGQLPAGQVWRLGADSSTTFTTSGDLKFGDQTLPKGIYSLWARKEADGGWKLVFNKQHGQWGTQHDDAQDIVSVPLKEEKEGKSSEMVEITLEKENGGGEFSVTWGNLELTATFE